ncbi:MAG TPA: hypothetical protein VKU80_01945, partial [Planctomycetota bacterium]|nr:hypothetical protein [Planctomycetota bacterium]
MIHLTHKLVTQFHRDLATQDWLQSCAREIDSRIRAKCKVQYSEGAGCVRSRFNEDRYMGPTSAVRLQFEVEVQLPRSGSPGG